MATYSVDCDEVFIRCTDIGVVELYDLDNLYFTPLKHKHWSHLGTMHMGVGKQYETLKIGNKDIRGVHLEATMHDLFCSRLMVNREGLCFLPAEGVDCDSGSLKIEYYRIFDKFDWGNYGVKAQLSTKWACRDVLNGRPLVLHVDDDSNSSNDREVYKKKLSEQEKELLEDKRALKELEKMVQTKGNELIKKQEEIEELEKKIKEVASSSTELKLYSYKYSNAQNVEMFFSNLAQSFTTNFPASKIVVDLTTSTFNNGFPRRDQYDIPIMVPIKSADSMSSLRDIHFGVTSSIKFDTDGWKVLKASSIVLCYWDRPPTSMIEYTAVYYDGNYGETQLYGCQATMPISTSAVDISSLHSPMMFYIAGIGVRLATLASKIW